MQLIGLTGLAASGKSTVAQYLVEQHGFTRLSFAAPLKKMLRTLNPYVVGAPLPELDAEPLRVNDLFAAMTENEIKTSSAGPEYRRLLQVLGTDCIRAIDENFWVNAALRQITDADNKVVFDDVRFPNEAAVITHFNKWGLWNVKRVADAAADGAHSSEMHAGKMGETQTLHNTGSFEHLFRQVDQNLEFTFAGVKAA